MRLMRSLKSPAQLISDVVENAPWLVSTTYLIRGAFEAAHGVEGKNSSALGGDEFGVFIANGSVVRDSGGGNYDGSPVGGVGFDLAQLFGPIDLAG